MVAAGVIELHLDVSGQRPVPSGDRLRGAGPTGRPQRGQEEEGREEEDSGGADQHHPS